MQNNFIGGSALGLRTDVKPFLLPDQAFQYLENAYVWRERVVKRQGVQKLGRLRRLLSVQPMGVISSAIGTQFNIITGLGLIATEPNAQIEPGDITNITIAIAAPINQTLTDTAGTGVMTVTGAGPISSATINYATSVITLTYSGPAGASNATFTGAYYPSLPVMGALTREIATENNEETIFFDTKYAYIYSSGFSEWIAGTTWNGSDSDFFWGTNYRGANAFNRLFFVTNFVNDVGSPIRYSDGTTWTNFAPQLDTTPNLLLQARIIIPYFGRLLALNTYEGTNYGAGTSNNYFNRCRFSQVGSPIDANAWRTDIIGRGGFIDAPTNEAIISAAFFKNTLIVYFERSTWQLRYQGEYGFPFIWERISSDFGCDSTFSSILFDEGVLTVGDKAITASSGVNVKRIDNQIPDFVFNISNTNEGRERTYGIRDFQKELVYWTYPYAQDPGNGQYFPNSVLVYNYRNNTYATFRDNVTVFGTYQAPNGITWNNTNIKWDDEAVTWDDPDEIALFPLVCSGNQQGFVHLYGYRTPDDTSLSITSINFGVSPVQITVPNHNLFSDTNDPIPRPEIIYITGCLFDGADPGINDQIFAVQFVDANTLELLQWDSNTQLYGNVTISTSVNYVGAGEIALFPRLDAITKDFNIYQDKGLQTKLIHVDFLMDSSNEAAMTVNLFVNSSFAFEANVDTGNKNVETSLPSPYYTNGNNIAWHRFHATTVGQYFNLEMTYNEDLMNDIDTHNENWVLNAMNVVTRPGGKIVF